MESDQTIETLWRRFSEPLAVLSSIWDDLQDYSKIENATEADIVEFLWTMHFLAQYPTEKSLSNRTGWNEKKVRAVCEKWVALIASLSVEKIAWPEEWNNDPNHEKTPIFIATVDGTHCSIQEPTTGHKYSKNPKY